jgi:hypothetical protein
MGFCQSIGPEAYSSFSRLNADVSLIVLTLDPRRGCFRAMRTHSMARLTSTGNSDVLAEETRRSRIQYLARFPESVHAKLLSHLQSLA